MMFLFQFFCDNHPGVATFNFVSERRLADVDLLGVEESDCQVLTKVSTWAHIVSATGIFSSISKARNAGFNVPIEPGFSEAFFSRSDGTPLFVFILN